MTRALLDLWPELERAAPFVPLGDFPTPVESLATLARELGAPGAQAFVKRDDISSEPYGGNKVRALEPLFGFARQRGATKVYATGAFGSNHALATSIHAPRAGLASGAILFPQPVTPSALATLRVLVMRESELETVPHWSALPWGMARARARALAQRERLMIMPPGGATPRGVLGYVSAGLELALQVEQGLLPAPRRVFVPTGSNATSAGLLAGFAAAAALGIGFRARIPEVSAIRIGPWPVTSRTRVLGLSLRTLTLLARLIRKPRLLSAALARLSSVSVSGRYLGRGYGHPTPAGDEACELFRAAGLPILDETYSGKAAAALIAALRAGDRGPILFWSTKSSRPLPQAPLEPPARTPAVLAAWLRRAARGGR